MILKMIPMSVTVADIGTDHGFLPIRLMEEKKAVKVIASDVAEGPLSRAREHIREAEMEDRIETRLGPGLSVLRKGEADTIVVAGMGGLLIIDLLEQGKEIPESASHLVLSPHKDCSEVRRYLMNQGFQITDEEMVSEDGKYYPILLAAPRRKIVYTDREILFGPVLLKKKTEDFRSYLLHEKERVEGILERRKESRKETEDAELQEYLSEVEDVLKRFIGELGKE